MSRSDRFRKMVPCPLDMFAVSISPHQVLRWDVAIGGVAVYGTVARLQVKPGKEAELQRLGQEMAPQIPGFVFQHVYRTEADPNELYLVVGFESEKAYRDNAESPAQQQRYEQYRSLLDADPEWHDGEIIAS